MASPCPHILFAGGGTAGHLNPGLAVARQLAHQIPRACITFAGCGKPHEQHTVTTAGYQHVLIPGKPTPRSPWQTFRFVTDNVAGYLAANWILREQRVSLVVGLGGYASAAAVRAAISRSLPTVLLEQNVIPGRATTWLAPKTAMVCASFHEVRSRLQNGTTVRFTGNPVRPEFQKLYWAPLPQMQPKNGRRPRRLLILGGSGGARSLNENLPKALYKLGNGLRGWRVVHQTGGGQLRATQDLYRRFGIDALVISYIDELAEAMWGTDLVVSRAGGTTIAELAMAGVPTVLVPFPHAVDDHQTANARVLANASACRIVDELDTAGRFDDRLAGELRLLMTDENQRHNLGRHIRAFAHPDAATDVASAIGELLQVSPPVVRRRAA